MTDAISTAWLLSIPFVLYFAVTKKRQLFAPQHRLARLCLFVILLANGAIAICHTLDFRFAVFETDLLQYGGLALLCFIWIRGTYLVTTGRKQQIAPGP
jgi:hypothetical protein